MLKNTSPYSNNRHVSHICQLPHILKINLHTRLDDGKDPKSKIDDKTKNELKEKIKNELEKDLKCEFDDKTKEKLKNKIKDEVKDEIDCKCDKDAIQKEIEDKIKDKLIKDEVKKELIKDPVIDEVKDNINKERPPEDGIIVTPKVITPEHAMINKCGAYSGYYKYSPENQVGHYAFNTSDILKKLYPEMFDNPKIMEHIKSGANAPYSAHNFKLAFSDDINYAWGSPSNMWCQKCTELPNDYVCKSDKENKSLCYSAKSSYDTKEYSKNFFNEECPNLVSKPIQMGSEEQNIITKQGMPLLLVNYKTGKIINKDGEETDQHYAVCQHYLKDDGRPKSIEDCGNGEACKKCIKTLNESIWDAGDKTIILKIPAFNDQMLKSDMATSATSIYENENNNASYYTSNNDLI
ncbi:ENY2 family protein [Wolbachia endosymbiont (group B) of Apotomis betuletana]|uniref:ENY2 family protein n=1 Tax=Wolbachia endosymbiont (group B) of Apotomis betuletana TaxID=2953982 RepID=UPI002226C6C1|nr:ENY2 family protein [Wolbachia endosymbiont (group B) of Apotomis betuletana]